MADQKVQEQLYLDDLQVGQRFVSDTHTITADEIKEYAKQFDPQPFHLDEVAAEKSFFNGLAASGWHTAALTMRLLVGGGLPIGGGLIGAGGEISWNQATRPGDTLKVVSEVVAIKRSTKRPERGRATVKSETLNQNDEVLQTFTMSIVVFARP